MSYLKLFTAAALLGVTAQAQAILLDFETEDDFSTPLINGQIIDPAFDPVDLEFGNLVNISSTTIGSDGHVGVTVFDSDPADQLPNTQDDDLLVGLGNILILQNDDSTNSVTDPTYGETYTFPNDEANNNDRGSIRFDFTKFVQLIAIDLVDVNGGVEVTVTATDFFGNTTIWDVPSKWTHDVTVSPMGWDTLFLNVTTPQNGEGTGGDAVATVDPGFDPTKVISLDIAIEGSSPSGGIDNLEFDVTGEIPEPATLGLLGLGALAIVRRR